MEYIPGQFSGLIRQRQELVYARGLSHTSDSVGAIDALLSHIARNETGVLIAEGIDPRESSSTMDLITRNRWIRFYQQGRFVRHTLERFNQILGYTGK